MQQFYTIDFDSIYPTPTPHRVAEAYFNRLWRKLHIDNFSLLLSFYGKHRCLPAGNRVLMADGTWKNIEDIKIGDTVFSPQKDGSVIPSKVIQLTNYFCNDVYDVIEAKRKNRLLYSCSGNHNIPILAYCSKRKDPLPRNRFRKIKEHSARYISKIKNAEQSRVITFTTPPIDFKQYNAEIDPYCLGLWLGDGSCTITAREYSKSFLEKNPIKIGTKNTCYIFSITTNDSEIICAFKQRYNEINSIGSKQGTTAVTMRITSTGLFFKQLQRLQLIGTKSGTKCIPKECLLSSIDFRLQLLAGLIDTDGYINNQSNVIEITTKSSILADDISTLVHSLGGNGTTTKIKKKIKKINFEGTYYTVRFAFNKELLPELIKYVQVPRKKERLLKHIHIANNTNTNHKNYDPRNISIRCIPAKPQMVYGFTLDSNSHWFITNNWIVTCNSGKSLAAVNFSCILDSTFEPNLEKRIVYNGKDLINAFNEIREQNIHGGAVIVDEAGSGELSSQRWYEEAAKIISAELQAVGYLNPFIGFVTQNFSFINTTARKLSQGVFEVDRTHNEYNTIKPFWIENNPWMTNTYRRYPIFCEKHNNVISNVFKINRIKFGLTPEPILSRYKIHSQAYKDRLLKQSMEELEILDTMKQQKHIFVTGIDAISEEVFINVDDYSKVRGEGICIDEGLIKHRHELTWRDAKLVKALVEKKLSKNGS